MERSVIVILSSHFDARNEVGGWFIADIDQLEASIQQRLESAGAKADVIQGPLAGAGGAAADANSILLIEFVLPELEDDAAELLENARLARVHAALARELSDAQRQATRLSPVFPLIAVRKKTAATTPPPPAARGGGKKGKGKTPPAPKAVASVFEFSDRLVKAAGATGEPDWLQCSRYDDPPAAHLEYAAALVERVKQCPLKDRAMTVLVISAATRASVATVRKGGMLELLPLFFRITDTPPEAQRGKVAAWFSRKSESEPHATYLHVSNEAELDAALTKVPRTSSVLASMPFDPRPLVNNKWSNWAPQHEHVDDLGLHLVFLKPVSVIGGQKRASNQ